jgi:phage terminase large subunit GpA-like protein
MTALDRRLIETALNAFRPPERPSTATWAERTMRLTGEMAAQPGPLRLAPMQRQILDAVDDVSTSVVVLMLASQTGKSTIIDASLLRAIVVEPSPMMLVHPTEAKAKDFVRTRLDPLIAANAEVRSLIGKDGNGEKRKGGAGGDGVAFKSFPGGSISVVSAHKPEDLAARAIARLYIDECDRYPASAGREGDPVMLAMKRTRTFADRRIVIASTPTATGASRIAEWYRRGTMERFSIPCRACGTFFAPTIDNVKWEAGKPRSADRKSVV